MFIATAGTVDSAHPTGGWAPGHPEFNWLTITFISIPFPSSPFKVVMPVTFSLLKLLNCFGSGCPTVSKCQSAGMLSEYPHAGSLYVTQAIGAGLAFGGTDGVGVVIGAAAGVGLLDGAETTTDFEVDGDPQAPTSSRRTKAEANRNVNMICVSRGSSAALRDLSSSPS